MRRENDRPVLRCFCGTIGKSGRESAGMNTDISGSVDWFVTSVGRCGMKRSDVLCITMDFFIILLLEVSFWGYVLSWWVV